MCIQTRLAGFESTWLTGVSQLDRPVTDCLEGSCSIQLSYGTYIFFNRHFLPEGESFLFSSLSICIQTRLAGFESTWLTCVSQLDRPVTYCLEGSCSIQLSYETDIIFNRHFLPEGESFLFRAYLSAFRRD
ncbi:MAG: hypothetical protein IPO65_13235 [Saprospiraceae bacterium]|nr:hypothetical protein [Saprospiraceae bacterium]